MSKEKASLEKQQSTLEDVTKLASLENRVNKLEERVLKTEVLTDSLSEGHSIICHTLENAGLMKTGEPVQLTWNPEKIPWKEAEGTKGKYQRYPPENEKAESTDDYRNMLADLKVHNGRLTREGWFYWIFQDGGTIGRKARGKETEGQAEKATAPDFVGTVKAKFPKELADMLTFKVEGQFVIIKPRQFLGSESFAKVASIVREIAGNYISAGKASCFKVPIQK